MHQCRSSVMHCLHRRFRVICIISAPTETPAWLWKSQATSLIATCNARASTKAKKKKKIIIIIIWPDFGRSYTHLSFSKTNEKQGIPYSSTIYLHTFIWHQVFFIVTFLREKKKIYKQNWKETDSDYTTIELGLFNHRRLFTRKRSCFNFVCTS